MIFSDCYYDCYKFGYNLNCKSRELRISTTTANFRSRVGERQNTNTLWVWLRSTPSTDMTLNIMQLQESASEGKLYLCRPGHAFSFGSSRGNRDSPARFRPWRQAECRRCRECRKQVKSERHEATESRLFKSAVMTSSTAEWLLQLRLDWLSRWADDSNDSWQTALVFRLAFRCPSNFSRLWVKIIPFILCRGDLCH